MAQSLERGIGVDFGTSTSLVAQVTPTGAQVFPVGDRAAWLPSVAGFDEGRYVVGEAADDLPPDLVIRSVKRAITDNVTMVGVGAASVPADDVIVAILAEIAGRAAAKGLTLTERPELRLSCPAMWTGAQRRRLLGLAERAGMRIGLNGLIDEPVAAGIAWLAATPQPVSGRVLVFDMGGGTLDVAVLDVHGAEKGRAEVSVLAALGMARAGDYLDELIAGDLTADLADAGVEVAALDNPGRAHDRLVLAAREAKEALSQQDSFPVVLPRRQFGSHDLRYTRARLEECFAFPMESAEQLVLAALRTARITERLAGATYDIMRLPVVELAQDISAVVLAGGMSRIPYVAARLRALFPQARVVEFASEAPEQAVALGLAAAGDYGRINMFRPGFDIELEWDDGRHRRSLYEAYSPLYEPWQVARGGSELCHRRTGVELGLPLRASGRLRVSSQSGEPVLATVDGRPLDGFPIAVNEQKFDFTIYCDGIVALTDGDGSYDGDIGWAPIQGRDSQSRREALVYQAEPEVTVWYPFDRERYDSDDESAGDLMDGDGDDD